MTRWKTQSTCAFKSSSFVNYLCCCVFVLLFYFIVLHWDSFWCLIRKEVNSRLKCECDVSVWSTQDASHFLYAVDFFFCLFFFYIPLIWGFCRKFLDQMEKGKVLFLYQLQLGIRSEPDQAIQTTLCISHHTLHVITSLLCDGRTLGSLVGKGDLSCLLTKHKQEC